MSEPVADLDDMIDYCRRQLQEGRDWQVVFNADKLLPLLEELQERRAKASHS